MKARTTTKKPRHTAPPATRTSIAIDIGNSRIATGMFLNGNCEKVSYNETIKAYLTIQQLIESGEKRIALCSVVPSACKTIVDALSNTGVHIRQITTSSPHPLIGVYKGMGADRLADAAAAWRFYSNGYPCVVLAFGTATTLTAVSPDAHFRGGLISLGLGSILNALHTETELLPEVPLIDEKPHTIELAHSTPQAIANGAISSQIGLATSWIKIAKNKLGADAKIIATGGWSKTLARYIDKFDYVDEYLTLKGVDYLAWDFSMPKDRS